MLDRKFLRDNRDLVAAAVAAKRDSADVDAYYLAHGERRACPQEYEERKAEANRANKARPRAVEAGNRPHAPPAGPRPLTSRASPSSSGWVCRRRARRNPSRGSR